MMVALFDLAMLGMTLELARGERSARPHARMLALVMGVGFLIGAVNHCCAGGTVALLLYALGFMLSYTAFLLTVPERRAFQR